MEVTTILDINDICRVCLAPINSSEVSSLFFMGSTTIQLWSKIMACAWVQICEGDGLPSSICTKCHSHLDVAYNFKQQCESADTHLRQVLGLPTSNSCLDGQPILKRDYTQNHITTDTYRSEYSPKLISNDACEKQISIISEIPNYTPSNIYAATNSMKSQKYNNVESSMILNSSQNTVTCGTQYEDVDSYIMSQDKTDDLHDEYSDTSAFNSDTPLNELVSDITKNNVKSVKKCVRKKIKSSRLKTEDFKNHINTLGVTETKVDENVESDQKKKRHIKARLNTSKDKDLGSKSPMSEQCELCGKVFRYRGYMAQHMRTHSGHKPHQCHVCQQRFSVYNSLVTHMRIHSGDKPFICQTCGKGFTQSAGLTTHMRSHTGERPFKCEICDKSFTQSSNLLIHRKIHTGKRDHVCSTCNKAFKFMKHLQSHIKIHTGIKDHTCSVCHKEFHRKSYLNTHMSIHSGHRPHKCSVCDHAFSNSSNLTAHMRIHTGIKPYVCQVCKKSFVQSSALSRHVQQHADVPRAVARGTPQFPSRVLQKTTLNCK